MSPHPSPTRAAVIAEARRWLGTPYHHQASLLGVGTDCIGLVRGVWRTLLGPEPEVLPGYSRDWAEATGTETLIETARRHLTEIAPGAARPGDVVVFRYRPRVVAKHAGILTEITPRDLTVAAGPPTLTFIHAIEGAPVTEVPLVAWWRRRIAAVFTFPGIID